MTGTNVSGYAVSVTPPTDVLYGALGGSSTTSNLYTIDPGTAVATSVGAIGFAMTGLSFRPADSVLFGATSNNSSANPASLVTIDTSTGAGTLVGAFSISGGGTLADIAFRSDNTLYGYGSVTRKLYTVNTSTGAATQVSATAVPPAAFGFATGFDTGGTLYTFPKGDAGIFYIVDPATAALTAQPTLSGSPLSPLGQISAGKFDSSDVFWATITASGVTWLATIDVGTAVITGVATTTSLMDALAWGPA